MNIVTGRFDRLLIVTTAVELISTLRTPVCIDPMSAFSDAVRYCFPAAGSSSPSAPLRDVPLTQNGQRRPDAVNWGQQEDDDLSRNVVPASIGAVIKSYAPDWLLAAVLWGVLAVLNRSGGHKREFSLNDISIQHSHAEHERVPPL